MGAADKSQVWSCPTSNLSVKFGSACVLPRTGVLMQNRGAVFARSLKCSTRFAPGRLPFRTAQSGAGGAARWPCDGLQNHGGDGQPQTTGYVVFPPCARQPLDQALDAPR
jgi:gamma-glutamyltranspeptidase/glutathione hydrolase